MALIQLLMPLTFLEVLSTVGNIHIELTYVIVIH